MDTDESSEATVWLAKDEVFELVLGWDVRSVSARRGREGGEIPEAEFERDEGKDESDVRWFPPAPAPAPAPEPLAKDWLVVVRVRYAIADCAEAMAMLASQSTLFPAEYSSIYAVQSSIKQKLNKGVSSSRYLSGRASFAASPYRPMQYTILVG